MATLALTAVGSLVGGPIGGAIGAVLGSRIDGALFAPSRRGPRIGDLSVQTSAYGNILPKLFGTMRVAGTVIWATDLREDSHRSGGGKGGGSATTYSYSASFAVALSSRPIRAVRRIWADGKLLRGAGGDWKSEVAAFRLHMGDEDQELDPLMASADGLASVPAHRGLAYAVFDTLQLADFGNRIPSLTFEVEADAGEIDIGAIVTALSEGAVVGSAAATVNGYAAGGDSVRAAIETLAAAYPLSISDDGVALRIDDATESMIDDLELGTRDGEARESRVVRDRRAAAALPEEVALAYYAPERDYQAGLQRARRSGPAMRTTRIELPAAISASAAKGVAEAALTRAWRERERATVRLPWRRLNLRAGQHVGMGGARWRIAGWSLERMAVALDLVRSGSAAVPVKASPGQSTPEEDLPAGTTVIHLLDIPAFDGSVGDAPRLWLATAGTGPGWRRATASVSLDAGVSWRALGMTAPATTMGVVIGAVTPGPRELIDRTTQVEVELLHDRMSLPGGGDQALLAGQNLALIGDELIAFADARQAASRRWILSGLLRGRFGTDSAMDMHYPGERFVLIEAGRLLPVDLPASALSGPAAVSARAPGDIAMPAMVEAIIVGRSLRPPSPVAVTANRLADGTIRIRWIRRSRGGWAWLDGADVPLIEDGERYRLGLESGGARHIIEIGSNMFDYPAEDQSSDLRAGPGMLTVTVEQLGRFGASVPPTTQTFLL